MSRPAFRIGLALEGAARDAVAAALLRAGYEVDIAASESRLQSMVARQIVDAWIFDARADHLLDVLLVTDSFLLPADNIPDPAEHTQFARWMAGLIQQLDAAWSRSSMPAGSSSADRWPDVQGVWLLAGSAGATSAIQAFLNAFRHPPPVAFIYVQHLDPAQHEHLHQFTLQNKQFSLSMAEGLHSLQPGRLLMISPRCKVTLNKFGQMASTRTAWDGEHTPDINEMLVILSAAKLPACGAIVFSGMGDDGAASLGIFAASGGRIWAQSPDSAICPAMPQAAINSGLVQRYGDPATLAAHIACLYDPV